MSVFRTWLDTCCSGPGLGSDGVPTASPSTMSCRDASIAGQSAAFGFTEGALRRRTVSARSRSEFTRPPALPESAVATRQAKRCVSTLSMIPYTTASAALMK
jgi:hypothetical protein